MFPSTGVVGYRLGKDITTEEYQDWKPIDEQMSFHERIRLLYVACTRAAITWWCRCTARPGCCSRPTSAYQRRTARGRHGGSFWTNCRWRRSAASSGALRATARSTTTFRDLEDRAHGCPDQASRPRVVAATALTDEGGLDAEGEPGAGLEAAAQRPRSAALGEGPLRQCGGDAVHGVFQTIDLLTGAGLEEWVAAQCEAEAVSDRTADVQRLVLAALGVAVRTRGRCWRALAGGLCLYPVVDGRLLEGYIDLLYRTSEGLVVVDYKTANRPRSEELDLRGEVLVPRCVLRTVGWRSDR